MPSDKNATILHTVTALTVLGLFAVILGGCSLRPSKSKPDTRATEVQATHETVKAPGDRSIKNQILELKTLDGPFTERIGDEIRIIWDSEALFDFDSAMFKKNARVEIDKLSKILNRYPDTGIVVTGHTDNEGSEDYNLKLSKRQAESLKAYLVDVGVSPSRLEAFGLGARQPIAPNDTEEGRRHNRRIEIQIRPNAPPPDTGNN